MSSSGMLLACVMLVGLVGCGKGVPTSPSPGPNPGLQTRLELSHLPVVGDTATARCRIFVTRTAFFVPPKNVIDPLVLDTLRLAHVWFLADREFRVESPAEFIDPVKLGDTLIYAIRIRAVSSTPKGQVSDLSLRATFADSGYVNSDGLPPEIWGHSLLLIVGPTSTTLYGQIGPN